MALLTQKQAADLAGVTTRAFRDWDVLAAEYNGKQPLYRSEDVEAERQRRYGQSGDYQSGSGGNARDQLEAERVRKLRLANDLAEGSLVPLADAKVFAAEIAALVAGQLSGLPSRLANELAGISDPGLIRDRLRFEVTRIRKNLSDRLALVGALARGSGGVEAGAHQKPGRVGKRKSGAAARKRRAGAVSD